MVWFYHNHLAVHLEQIWKSESDETLRWWKILEEGNVFISPYFRYLACEACKLWLIVFVALLIA